MSTNNSFLDYKYTQPSDNFVRVPIAPRIIQNHSYNDTFYLTLYRLSRPTPKERYLDKDYYPYAQLARFTELSLQQVKRQLEICADLNLIIETADKIILPPLIDQDVVRLRKDLVDKLLQYHTPQLITIYAYLYEHRDPEPVSTVDLTNAFGYTQMVSKTKFFRSTVEQLYMDHHIALRFVRQDRPWTIMSTPL